MFSRGSISRHLQDFTTKLHQIWCENQAASVYVDTMSRSLPELEEALFSFLSRLAPLPNKQPQLHVGREGDESLASSECPGRSSPRLVAADLEKKAEKRVSEITVYCATLSRREARC